MSLAITTAADQDISAIAASDWLPREFPLGPREKPTRRCVIFKQSVLNDVRAHGKTAPDIEVCGVLVGNVYQDAMGPFVFVEASIRGNFSAGKNAQVTFTAKTWAHIQDVMDQQYPDMRILGWYHTHPGHGIFLSDMDLFIHKNFFSLPWHLAFVFDPQALEEGLFAWRQGNMVVESFVVQKDVAADTMKVARRLPEAPPQPIIPTPTVSAMTPIADAMPADDGNGEAAGAATLGETIVGTPSPALNALTSAAPPMPMPSVIMPPPAAPEPGPADEPIESPQAHPMYQPRAAELSIAAQSAMAPPAALVEMKDLAARIAAIEKRQRWTLAGLALLVLVAIGWPIALAAFAMVHSGPSGIDLPFGPTKEPLNKSSAAAAADHEQPASPATPAAAPAATEPSASNR
jgi:proteasome lid subunit RPN8/RPN11